MQKKAKMKALLKKLNNGSEYQKGFGDALKWVMEDVSFDSLGFNFEENATYKPATLNTNKQSFIYIMPDPLSPEKYYIEKSIPLFSPLFWWKRIEVSDKPSEDKLSLGNDYFGIGAYDDLIEQRLLPESLSWEVGWQLKKDFPSYFKSKKNVDTYMKNFKLKNQEDRVEMDITYRKEIMDNNSIASTQVKKWLWKNHKLEFISSYRKDREDIWIFKQR